MPVIRRAKSGDARLLAELAATTFSDTFAAANTREDIERHCREHYREDLQAREIADPGMATLLSDQAGQLIGFAQLRWGTAPACVSAESPTELLRLYVARDWHGKGVAADLMAACLEATRARASDALWLGVWEHNPRAIAFYRKFGFVEVGEHVFTLGTDPQRDLVMSVAVKASASARNHSAGSAHRDSP